MAIINYIFTGITKLQEKLDDTQLELENTSNQLSEALFYLPVAQDPTEDSNIIDLRTKCRQLLDKKNRLQKDYDLARDLARRLIDHVEDNDIALGLQLHYVNCLPWNAIKECLGISDIRQLCEEFLEQEENEF